MSEQEAKKVYQQAAKEYEEALRIFQLSLGRKHSAMGITKNNLAQLEIKRGNRDEAM